MATFSALVTTLATELRDPSNLVWSTTMLGRFLNKALHDVGRVAPTQFYEELATVADTLTYVLTNGSEWTEVTRVEVWDVSATPDEYVRTIPPKSREYADDSRTGWFLWEGDLHIPPQHAALLEADVYTLRVWGWAPYTEKSGSDAMPTGEKEHAIIEGARIQALKSLLASRNLFTQWQAQGSSSDLTLAGLQAQLSAAQEEHRRLLRAITVPRGGN